MAGFQPLGPSLHRGRRCKCRARNVDEAGWYIYFFFSPAARRLIVKSGQRIVARLRGRTFSAAIRQDVEFVERGEGDVLSRLSVDTSIVGERSVFSYSSMASSYSLSQRHE